MASRRLFHRQNGELETAWQEKSYLRVIQIEAPLYAACPCTEKHVNSDLFRKASDRIESIEYTLETLRIMKTFFDGTSRRNTSIRDSYMAGVVDGMVRANPMKIILLARNVVDKKPQSPFRRAYGCSQQGSTRREVNYRDCIHPSWTHRAGNAFPIARQSSLDSLL